MGGGWRMRLAVVAVTMGAGLGLGLGMGAVLAQGGAGVALTAAETSKLLPASVFFRGQSATTQLRNSGGVKFSDGMYVLSTLVDTSGYSTDVQEKYQAYFITEVGIKIEGHALPAGIYGVGFVGDNKFIVLDVGAHELFAAGSHTDDGLKRPVPLKMTAEKDGFRLYAGRRYVGLER